MREPQPRILLLPLLVFLCGIQAANAQVGPTALQPGTPIERALAGGQSHSYNINLEADQFLQVVVDQRGIDVVVRVFSPTGRRLSEVDTPNGTDGPEDVTVVAVTAGLYRIDVAPLDPSPPAGRYEIKIVELRKATEQELQSGANQEVFKAKGLALLTEITQSLPELHRAQTRAGFQIKVAQLLWTSDEKQATKLMEQAIDSVKEFIADIDNTEGEYYESFQIAMQLREQVVETLAPHDPEMALNFLRATRTLATPEGFQFNGQGNRELQLELALASQVINSDPKRAFQMAEDTLKKGASPSLVDTLNRLRSKDAELAAKLAHDIATKIMEERLLTNSDAAYLAASFLRIVRPMGRSQMGGGDSTTSTSLISEDEFRDLFQKILSEVLAYSPPSLNAYTQERNLAQNLVSTLKQMSADVQRYAPDKAAALDKKWLEFSGQSDQQNELRQRLQNTLNSATPEAALESVTQAPREIREQLYQQVAGKFAQAGDFNRARQIINDQIKNPMQRQQALRNLEQQAIYGAAARGKIAEALRGLSTYRPVNERAQILSQIVTQIGPGLKKETVLLYLEQARNVLDPSPQAQDQQQMYALLAIGRAFSKYNSARAFEIVEPLIDQFNEITASALTLNGFGQKYYQDGELITTNGNAVAETANQLATTLSILAQANFERAKAAVDRIHPVDPRINIYLTIARQAIQPTQDR